MRQSVELTSYRGYNRRTARPRRKPYLAVRPTAYSLPLVSLFLFPVGCGMELVRIAEKDIDLAALDKLIYAKIPSGFNYRSTHHEYTKQIP